MDKNAKRRIGGGGMETSELIRILAENEESIMRLYGLYAGIFPDEKIFWEKMAFEEREHAELIRGLSTMTKMADIRISTSGFDAEGFRTFREYINGIYETARNGGISRNDAIWSAIKIERTIFELKLLDCFSSPSPDVTGLFEQLKDETQAHFDRLSSEFPKIDK
jgi:hypothetical protein